MVWCDDDASGGDDGFHFLTKNTKKSVAFSLFNFSTAFCTLFRSSYNSLLIHFLILFTRNKMCKSSPAIYAEPLTPA